MKVLFRANFLFTRFLIFYSDTYKINTFFSIATKELSELRKELFCDVDRETISFTLNLLPSRWWRKKVNTGNFVFYRKLSVFIRSLVGGVEAKERKKKCHRVKNLSSKEISKELLIKRESWILIKKRWNFENFSQCINKLYSTLIKKLREWASEFRGKKCVTKRQFTVFYEY